MVNGYVIMDSKMSELSHTDRRLLAALKMDGRASVTRLAGMMGVSRATVQASLERLTGNGTIERFTVDINVASGVDAVRAVTTIELQGNLASRVIRALRSIDEIVSLHTTNGAWDLVAQIETVDLAAFDAVLRRIREIEGVLNSESSILLNRA